jgi:hypothetical protein
MKLNPPAIGLLALLFATADYGQHSRSATPAPQLSLARLTVDEPAQAFGRYLASVEERDPFDGPGLIGVEVEASLPKLAESGSMVAVRRADAAEGKRYRVIRLAGTSTVKQQVIARYLEAEEQAAKLPYSSVAITPGNYRFRYEGPLKANGATAYVFQISPKKTRAGMLQGQIWIDLATGVAVRQTGRLVKRPSVFIRRIELTRDISLRDGVQCARVTHVVISTRLVGRAELTVTERPLAIGEPEAEAQFVTEGPQ